MHQDAATIEATGRRRSRTKEYSLQAKALCVEVRELRDVVADHAAQRHGDVRTLVGIKILVLCEMTNNECIASQSCA